MDSIAQLALANVTSPPVLFFALGALAAIARSDLSIPEQIGKGMSLYLLLSIGFKGGVAARNGAADISFLMAALAGLALAFIIPVIAFLILSFVRRVDTATRAAVAAHYGSISIVTFVAGQEAVRLAGLDPNGYMTAVAAMMEMPAIAVALFLLALSGRKAAAAATANGEPANGHRSSGALLHEVIINGSIVLLVGAFVIGLVAGDRGMARIDLFVNGIFQGVLCLFLLDLGLVAVRRLLNGARLSMALVVFGFGMPLLSATLAMGAAYVAGLGAADAAILAILAASASYIAAPAAMRMAVPEADAGVYLPLAIGVTFPFNLTIGIPLYIGVASTLFGS
jgi:uncharacterized protein